MRDDRGDVVVDEVWANELLAAAKILGSVKIAAPELAANKDHVTWGPTETKVSPDSGVEFVGFPVMKSHRELWRLPAIRRILHREVEKADIIHTSNFFPPYLGLYCAHDFATELGKKTVFIVSEDFYDMMAWEWVRTATAPVERLKRKLTLAQIDAKARKAASTATITFMNTPASVSRYRLDALNGEAIRHPTHNAEEVITQEELDEKCKAIKSGAPLVIVAVCRHKPLKGLDYLIRAIGLLKQRGVFVQARIYGFGPDTEALKKLATDSLVADRVAFLGAVAPGKPLYAAIAQGHVFAMIHRTNDFGRTFYDAMCAGTPVLAFHTPASCSTLREGTDGVLVPLDNTIALSMAIEELDRGRDRIASMSQCARARALVDTQEAWLKYRYERIRALL